VLIHTMNARKPIATMSDVIRRAIVESGISHQRLERATGVTRASIMRFVRGDQSLRLDKADLLAQYFGLELQMKG
jgi:plasmid maintenance system antidote protein VapI